MKASNLQSLTFSPSSSHRRVSTNRVGKVHVKGHENPEWGWSYSSTLSLTSALDGVGGQSHVSVALTPGKRPDTHCTGDWVGPRADLEGCGKSRPNRDLIPGPSRSQQVAIPTELS